MQLSSINQKSIVALGLTLAAGYVDIAGYITAFHTFTAHMTGNTVHLAQDIVLHDVAQMSIAGGVLVAFVLGSLGGRILIEIGARRKIRTIASLTLGIEAALLLILVISVPHGNSTGVHGTNSSFLVLIVLALAMGLQTATITRIGALTVHTTFVTGMINKLAQLLSHALFDTYDIAHPQSAVVNHNYSEHRSKTLRNACFIFSIWCLYLIGAMTGTLLTEKWQLRSLYLPLVLLCLAVASDQVSALAIEEEKEQFER